MAKLQGPICRPWTLLWPCWMTVLMFCLHEGTTAFIPVSTTAGLDHFRHQQHHGIYSIPLIRRVQTELKATTSLSSTSSDIDDGFMRSIEVTLFGIGDLRTDDHEGLRKSIERAATKSDGTKERVVLPLVVLDTASIVNIPGIIAHTEDTASMIAEAIKDLQMGLAKLNLPLYVDIGSDSVLSGLTNLVQSHLGNVSNVNVHVCDHGMVDNGMGYSPMSGLQNEELPQGWTLNPWKCDLRARPWEDVDSLPDTYNEYKRSHDYEPDLPVPAMSLTDTGSMPVGSICPTATDLTSIFVASMNLDSQQCLEERNSGLYGTHWGGLSPTSIGESKVKEILRAFVDDCQEEDEKFAKIAPKVERNNKSLEHATMTWNLRGDGKKNIPETNNVIAGELLSRYLLAPLLLGTLSQRRLWWSVKRGSSPFFESPLRTLVETREWHKLFAAKQSINGLVADGAMKYRYWRWHGFLTRYGEQTIHQGKSEDDDKDGILLIHGFGASANQWEKKADALSSLCRTMGVGGDATIECLAPDLIGFGQSEKPPVTYSGFTWESHTGDFIKEIAVKKNGWDTFTMGGNSIGGFVAMCAAANDATTDADAISGCGAPGTGRCTGAILMNAAGVIQSREDVTTIESSVMDRSTLRSVAQVVASDGLAPCKPLNRFVARVVGNGLLSYLRPRIQSICVNLYPTNPAAVNEDLCQNILRDSLDPGAINVMISGTKLPTPRTYNEVVAADFGQPYSEGVRESQFKGPVLVAQGILDPLNDAKGRAGQLKTLRKGIEVAELQGGHCPHDEIPEEVASAVLRWWDGTRHERQILKKVQVEV